MRLPEYKGFVTARERIASYEDILARMNECSAEELPELERDIEEFVSRMRAEAVEYFDYHDFDYIENIQTQLRQYRQFLQMKEDYKLCY